jgi:hypothetical protein
VKQRRLERVERRRPLVEFNLISKSEPRPSGGRRRGGCLRFLAPATLALALVVAHLLGLL